MNTVSCDHYNRLKDENVELHKLLVKLTPLLTPENFKLLDYTPRVGKLDKAVKDRMEAKAKICEENKLRNEVLLDLKVKNMTLEDLDRRTIEEALKLPPHMRGHLILYSEKFLALQLPP
jgi:hypothetical protein